jgi:hypothetical protein
MKYPFDLDNFESFLSEQADEHRMYASDRVWRNIQENLHGKDRWPALTFASLLTISVIAVLLTFTYPEKNLFNSPANYANLSKATDIVLVPKENEMIKVTPSSKDADMQDLAVSSNMVTTSPLESTLTEKKPEAMIAMAKTAEGIIPPASEEIDVEQSSYDTDNILVREIVPNNLIDQTETNYVHRDLKPLISLSTFQFNNTQSVEDLITAPTPEISSEKQEQIQREAFIKNTMDYGPQKHVPVSAKPSRWSLQFYGTPSVSYRYLLEDKKFADDPASVTGPLAPYLTNSVNEFVTHRPKLGLEAGGAILYQLADNFRVKSGLQINFRQYGIQAYRTPAQRAFLTLERGNSIDSIIRYTSISSQGGYKQIDLTSSFVQLAIPVGFDLKMANINKVDFYVSAAAQFTYQLSSSNYLLSSDFKNYIKQPDLDRKFNINTAIEAFASFEAGGVKWQAGPQIRYQLMPGSLNAYPIREHLVDYGFKIGVVKTLK